MNTMSLYKVFYYPGSFLKLLVFAIVCCSTASANFFLYDLTSRKFRFHRIYYTCSKTRLTENVFPLTPALTVTLTLILILSQTLTLKHNNVLGLTKWRHFSRKCTDTGFTNKQGQIKTEWGSGHDQTVESL